MTKSTEYQTGLELELICNALMDDRTISSKRGSGSC